jgi:C-terminal processing protease CtpA/Prc
MIRISNCLAIASVLFAGCDGAAVAGNAQPGTGVCSADVQKQFVLDAMRDVYYWNDLLPASVDLDAHATAEELLAYLISFQPLDGFSYIDLAANDAQFFGAGQYRGYGFSSRFEGPGDLRFTRVFSLSPAAQAGFARGQRIVMLNGRGIAEIEANEGVDTLFGQPSLEFTLRRADDSEFSVSIDQGLVTIDPLPQWRVIDRPDGTSVGYLELATFISTAESEFESVFAAFRLANVADVIVDLRYNGGGLIDTTELLGDYLGGAIANNLVFSRTLFNENNDFANRTRFFQRLLNSAVISRLVVISTNRTASASELIANSMRPHVAVSIVGDTTFGKPVGQLGIEFCDKILRPTAFETVNADNEGAYFGGLPADCPAPDDLSIAVGDDSDPNLVSALTLLDTGACPPGTAGQPEQGKPARDWSPAEYTGPAPPWREYASAW